VQQLYLGRLVAHVGVHLGAHRQIVVDPAPIPQRHVRRSVHRGHQRVAFAVVPQRAAALDRGRPPPVVTGVRRVHGQVAANRPTVAELAHALRGERGQRLAVVAVGLDGQRGARVQPVTRPIRRRAYLTALILPVYLCAPDVDRHVVGDSALRMARNVSVQVRVHRRLYRRLPAQRKRQR